MICSMCGGQVSVTDSANKPDGEVYRRRKCKGCGRIFYTIEFEVEKTDQLMAEWYEYRYKDNNLKQILKAKARKSEDLNG